MEMTWHQLMRAQELHKTMMSRDSHPRYAKKLVIGIDRDNVVVMQYYVDAEVLKVADPM